jgi:DNA polymerase-4
MPESASLRKIIHIDMDCFFAAVEEREHPELKGKPLAIGGAAERRGVLATCNYEARRHGLHSAMPTKTALQKCPELILRPVNMAMVKQASQNILSIFRRYTDIIEPLSLDEAYLDVTGLGSATLIARDIKHAILEEEQLTASAGVAPNKFLAKIASDWDKPDGLYVITPQDVDAFIRPLPVKNIHGVGQVTEAKLYELGIHTCGELQALSLDTLESHFGRFGQALYHYARGIDDRPVKTERIRKSLSTETTYSEDLPGLEACLQQIPALLEELQRRLDRVPAERLRPVHSVFVKIKFNNFQITTVQCPGDRPALKMIETLLRKGWSRHRRPVRLLGVGVHFEQNAQGEHQLELLDQIDNESEDLSGSLS